MTGLGGRAVLLRIRGSIKIIDKFNEGSQTRGGDVPSSLRSIDDLVLQNVAPYWRAGKPRCDTTIQQTRFISQLIRGITAVQARALRVS